MWEGGIQPTPPPAPDGMTTGYPDFAVPVIIQVRTTWWFKLIMAHPEIYVEHDKELRSSSTRTSSGHVSDRTGERGPTSTPSRRCSDDGYREPSPASGRPTTRSSYQIPRSHSRWPPPTTKILFLLRDPIDRYRSDLSRKTTCQRLKILRYRAMSCGLYSSILQQWEAEFDPENMLVLQFEERSRSPMSCWPRRTASTAPTTPSDRRDPHAGAARPGRSGSSTTTSGTCSAASTNLTRGLGLHAIPEIDLKLWPNFADRQTGLHFPRRLRSRYATSS